MSEEDSDGNEEKHIINSYQLRRNYNSKPENSLSINLRVSKPSENKNNAITQSASETQPKAVKSSQAKDYNPSVSKSNPKPRRGKYIAFGVGVICVAAIAIVVLILINRSSSPSTLVNPVPAAILDSVSYTVYYPTNLPKGYKIDNKSFSSPQSGVIVFNLVNSKGQKIYISQEARPTTFNFGGYYNGFKDRSEVIVSDGTIAVGKINNGATEIASLATNKTWIISNTSTEVPLNQLSDMLKSLLISH
jgi:hypothetical protein